jgi:hypothetical protein
VVAGRESMWWTDEIDWPSASFILNRSVCRTVLGEAFTPVVMIRELGMSETSCDM